MISLSTLVREPGLLQDRRPSPRFTTQDPLGFGGGSSNLYPYVMNDPTNMTDPTGMKPLDKIRTVVDKRNVDQKYEEYESSFYRQWPVQTFGGGTVLEVPNGPVGSVNVTTGVRVEEKNEVGKVFGNSIAIRYEGTKASGTDLQFIQFLWVEAKIVDAEGNATTVNSDQAWNLSGGGRIQLSKDATTARVQIDGGNNTNPYYSTNGLSAHDKDDKQYVVYDEPRLVSSIADDLLRNQTVKLKDKENIQVTAHFDTFLVYYPAGKKGQILYKIPWTVSYTAHSTEDNPPIQYELSLPGRSPGGWGLTDQERAALEAKFGKDQSHIGP